MLPASLQSIKATAFSGACISVLILPASVNREMLQQLAHALRFCFTWNPESIAKALPREYADVYLGISTSCTVGEDSRTLR